MQGVRREYNVTIVGAGLAGLATALSLAQAGHRVTVLESRSHLSEIGAGIQIPPNASRILFSWGLHDELAKKATQSAGLYIKRYDNGQVLCDLPQGERRGVDGLPHWNIYRPDYQNILYDAAIKHGVKIEFKAMVRDPGSLKADLVVLADGIGSKTRKYVLRSQEPELVISNNAYRVLIPREEMLEDPATAKCMTDGYQRLWAGQGRYIMSYPIAQGKIFNLVLMHPGKAEPGEWNRRASVQTVREDFSDFEPVVQSLLEKATECVDWTLGRLPPLPTWSSHDGCIVLIGDAAHAMTPDYAQGAAMCIEDAAVLTCCVSRASSVQEATDAFYGLRKERTQRIQQAAWDNGIRFTLPDGIEQRERDELYARRGEVEGRQQSYRESVLAKFTAWVFETDVVKEARAFWDAKYSAAGDPQKL